MLRFSLHQTSAVKFKSLIGRFRISYTEDDRIRELMLPAQSKLWSSIGPFPGPGRHEGLRDGIRAGEGHQDEPLDLKKSYTKVVLPPASQGRHRETGGGRHASEAGRRQGPAKKEEPAPDKDAARQPAASKPVPLPERPRVMENPRPRRVPAKSRRSRRCGRGRAPKPEQTGKPGPEGGKESKGNAAGAAEKPGPEATKDGKGEAKPAGATAESKAEHRRPTRPSPSPRRSPGPSNASGATALPARLQGANSAYYLTRKIVSTRPRTAMVQIAGPAGFRMWVNGELAQTSLPPPPAAPPKAADAKPTGAGNGPDAKNDEKAEDDKEEPAAPEINDATFDEADGTRPKQSGEEVPHRPPPGRKRDRREGRVRRWCEPQRPSRFSAGGAWAEADGRRSSWRRLVHFQYHAGRRRRPDP